MPTALDLWAGAGGSALGITKAGFDVLMAIDIDEDACKTHKLNFPETEVVQADLLTFDSFPKVDYIHASPPCTDISTANTSAKKDLKRGLRHLKRAVQIIEKHKPRFWTIENVPHVTHFLNWRYYKLNAADYGVPQIRKRVFFTNIARPVPTHAEHMYDNSFWNAGSVLKKWVSIKGALNISETTLLEARSITSKAHSPTFESDSPSSTVTSEPHTILQQDCGDGKFSKRSLEKPSFTIRGGRVGLACSAHWFAEEPSSTVMATEGDFGKTSQRFAGSKIGRKLEPKECAKLQSFPDDFVFVGNKSSKYRQIGNAVPPLMMEAIARSAMQTLLAKGA